MAIRPVAVALSLALGTAPVAGVQEELRYQWRLEGFLGAIASLFLPSRGEGKLTLEEAGDGRLKSELLITAVGRGSDDYFRYGAEWEPATGRTIRAWSSQRWRGEEKSKESAVDRVGVIDVATAVYALRRDPPNTPRQLEIWSNGKLYPVLVSPGGSEVLEVDRQRVPARRYTVRGVEVPGRRIWKGELELWFAEDGESTPVEIMVARAGARVRLRLVGRGPTVAIDEP